jgi:spermidine synthase
MHEVVWTRLLGHLFGVGSLAISTVLAAFMGGLALGSYWIGKRSDRIASPGRAYAWLELGIGICALLVPLLLDWVEPVYGWLWRRFHLSFGVFSLIRLTIAGGILLVPTILMGATLPVLAGYVRALSRGRVAPQWLYTLNLAGAVLGTAVTGFVLLPGIGVWGTIAAAAALNIGIGIAVLRMPVPPVEREEQIEQAPPEIPRPRRLLLVVAFLSGLISLGTQVAWTRVLTLVVSSTTYAFSTVLLVYLVALGAGSAWASRRGARVKQVGPDLAVMHALAALGTIGALIAVDRLPDFYVHLYSIWGPGSVGAMITRAMAAAFCLLIVPVFFAGTILPLALIGFLPPTMRGTGPAVGRIYAINTVGGIIGAVMGGFLLIPSVGSQATLIGAAAVTAVMGAVLAFARPAERRLQGLVMVSVLVAALAFFMRPHWNYAALHAGVFESARHPGRVSHMLEGDLGRPVFEREGASASVIVTENRVGAQLVHTLTINARNNASDGVGDMATQALVAHLPLLLSPRTDDVFILGWGSGGTVGSATRSPARRITCVELEPAVVEASGFFTSVNYGALQSPRVRLYEDDARHILLASDDTYDVIVSEPSHPWVSGVANLFTRDFYRLVARRLRPDGIFSTWIQAYEIRPEIYRSILASIQSVFPEVMVFGSPRSSDTIIIASKRRIRFDLDELARRWSYPPTRADLARYGLMRPEQLLAGLYLDSFAVRELARGARLNTDNNMLVEFHAVQGMLVADLKTRQLLEQRATPVETVLDDPSALLGSPIRLANLIEGRKLMNRPAGNYEERLKELRAATR